MVVLLGKSSDKRGSNKAAKRDFVGKLNEYLCKINYYCSVCKCARMRTHARGLELMSLWQGALQKLQVFLVETRSQLSSATCDFLFL